ncbi:MAG: HAMP domain-containing histidine kinase [Bacteriovoracaceae bacterium]|nr:HAMP domain-containing histidine kinase [Bacteriovoracaceae bacterium]
MNSTAAFEPQMLIHDLKSPFEALITLVESSINYMDNEQIKIFNLTKSRTEQLLRGHKKTQRFHVETSINEIIKEKSDKLKNIQIKHPKGNHFLKINKKEFQRVISNIIDNSIEALDSNQGGISIKTALDKKHLKIHIRDTGPGIDDLTLMRILKHGGSFGKTKGSGLGLLHAKKSLKQWGGKLEIDSIPGHGTVVTLKFPIPKGPSEGPLVSPLNINN